MAKIKVDIDELMDRLTEMKEDDYETTELEIDEDVYDTKLNVSAVSFDSDEPIDYGSISETTEEF